MMCISKPMKTFISWSPIPASAYLIGKMYLRRNDYAQAAEYLSKGTSMENTIDRADCHCCWLMRL